MKPTNRGSLIAGIGLIVLGALFVVFNLIPKFTIKETWPIVFFVIAFAFCLPSLAWPESKKGLAALLIPGAIFFGLGVLFLYNTLSNNWAVWAYAWILIPASVGLGLMLAGKVGGWNNNVWLVGVWMALISVTVFAVFAALFGNIVVKFIGAGVLVALGLLLLVRSILKKTE